MICQEIASRVDEAGAEVELMFAPNKAEIVYCLIGCTVVRPDRAAYYESAISHYNHLVRDVSEHVDADVGTGEKTSRLHVPQTSDPRPGEAN